MYFRLALNTLLIMTGILSQNAFGEKCEELQSTLQKHQARLAELQKLNTELDAEFDRHVSADFASQSEGVFNQLERNEALKVAFARKQLGKALREQEQKIKLGEETFCRECSKEASAPPCRR